MPPWLHFLLGFSLTLLGGLIGLATWLCLCHEDGLHLLSDLPFPVNLLAGAVAFFGIVVVAVMGVHGLWHRYVPARCRACGGRAIFEHGPRRQVIYVCQACGRRN